jgi:hypothetical protein
LSRRGWVWLEAAAHNIAILFSEMILRRPISCCVPEFRCRVIRIGDLYRVAAANLIRLLGGMAGDSPDAANGLVTTVTDTY